MSRSSVDVIRIVLRVLTAPWMALIVLLFNADLPFGETMRAWIRGE